MSFGIEAKKLKTLIDFYHPDNCGQELKYMVYLKGEEELFRSKPFLNLRSRDVSLPGHLCQLYRG